MRNSTQHHHIVNVWAVIINNRILVPQLSGDNIISQRYVNFLSLNLGPDLTILFPNEVDLDIPTETLCSQQQGASSYFAINLDEIFAGHRIRRRGTIDFPSRSQT